MDATPPSVIDIVHRADARVADLLHLADALPEFAVSPAFAGDDGLDSGQGATVTEVLAAVYASQVAFTTWVHSGSASTSFAPNLTDAGALSQHAHRPYKQLHKLLRERHAGLRETVLTRGDLAEAFEQLSGRYAWAHSVLGQCAL